MASATRDPLGARDVRGNAILVIERLACDIGGRAIRLGGPPVEGQFRKPVWLYFP